MPDSSTCYFMHEHQTKVFSDATETIFPSLSPPARAAQPLTPDFFGWPAHKLPQSSSPGSSATLARPAGAPRWKNRRAAACLAHLRPSTADQTELAARSAAARRRRASRDDCGAPRHEAQVPAAAPRNTGRAQRRCARRRSVLLLKSQSAAAGVPGRCCEYRHHIFQARHCVGNFLHRLLAGINTASK